MPLLDWKHQMFVRFYEVMIHRAQNFLSTDKAHECKRAAVSLKRYLQATSRVADYVTRVMDIRNVWTHWNNTWLHWPHG